MVPVCPLLDFPVPADWFVLVFSSESYIIDVGYFVEPWVIVFIVVGADLFLSVFKGPGEVSVGAGDISAVPNCVDKVIF